MKESKSVNEEPKVENENTVHTEKLSTVPGHMNPEETSEYRTIDERRMEVEVKDIIHFEDIPDFYNETHADHPIVGKTPDGYFCLDGWNLVQEAVKNKLEKIICKLYEMEKHSDTELALRKMEMRNKTEGGKAIYPETLRALSCIENKLKAENPDLEGFYHGGCRRGLDLKKSKSISMLISKRTGVSVNTIRKQLGHARHINPETFELLVNEYMKVEKQELSKYKPGRGFFENIRNSKKNLIEMMQGKNESDENITIVVSEFVAKCWSEYKVAGEISKCKIPSKNEESDNTGSSGTTEPDNIDSPEPESTVETDNILETETGPEDTVPITFDVVKRNIANSVQSIVSSIDMDKPTQELVNSVRAEIERLTDLSLQLESLIPNEDGEEK